jgi:hypothetical protein
LRALVDVEGVYLGDHRAPLGGQGALR